MFESIAPALFGLLGTIVGGLLTYRQQTLQGRESQRHELTRHAADQEERWRDARLQASVSFVNQADRLVDTTREYWDALDAGVSGEELERTRGAYLADWRTLIAGFASFQLTVTPEVNAAGSALRNAVKDYTVAVDAVARATNATARNKAGREAERVNETIWDLRRDFIAVAHSELGAPSRITATAG